MQKGTGYTNLQQYLSANRGNRLSNALASNVDEKANAATNDINSQKNEFTSGFNAAQTGINSSQQGAQQVADKLTTAADTIGDDDVNQYRNFQTLNYGGPAGLKNEGSVIQKANTAAAVGGLAGSRAGRGELLKSVINKPEYSRAGQEFDSTLVGNDIDTKLRGARQAAQQIPGQLNSAVEGSKNKVANAQNTLATNKTALDTSVKGVGTTLQDNVNQRLEQNRAASNTFNTAVADHNLNALSPYGYNVTPQDQARLDASKKFGFENEFFNSLINPTSASNISAGGVATADEKSKAAALSKLLNDTQYNQYTTGNPYQAASLVANPDAAKQVTQDQYNRYLNDIPLSDLQKISGYDDAENTLQSSTFSNLNPDVSGLSLSQLLTQSQQRQDPGSLTQDSPAVIALKSQREAAVNSLINKLTNDFGLGRTPIGRNKPQGT